MMLNRVKPSLPVRTIQRIARYCTQCQVSDVLIYSMTMMMHRRCVVLLLVIVALVCLVDVQCFSPATSSRITSRSGGGYTLSLHLGTNHHHDNDNEHDDDDVDDTESTTTMTTTTTTTITRRRVLLVETTVMLLSTVLLTSSSLPPPSNAAPPIAIIAEELGYFPVTNRNGDTVYVPKRVRRTSSSQSIDLAKHLQNVSVP